MKIAKLLSIVSLGVLTYAAGVPSISLGVKKINLSKIDLKDTNTYVLHLTRDVDFGQKGAWGGKFEMEFDYGSFKSGDEKLNYTELSFILAPTYTYKIFKTYAGIKIDKNHFDNLEGGIYGGVFGVELNYKHLLLGVNYENGKMRIGYLTNNSYNSIQGYLGFTY